MKNKKINSFSDLYIASKEFQIDLKRKKNALREDSFWYPYGTLNNFIHLCSFDVPGIPFPLSDNSKTVDIGAADGDLSFFLSTLGYQSEIIDNGPTNYNNLQGARLMANTFFQKVKITEIDLDAQFSVSIDYKYDLIFFLGILYHLQNPFYILEKLSYISNYMLLSTRVAKYYDIRLNEQSLTPEPINVVKFPVAYLLSHTESNNDPTNFWIFSESGLYRLLERTGWEI